MKQNLQKTLALIKPDLYRQTLLLPTVYQKLKDNNFTVLESQIIRWNYHQASQFYKEHEGKFFFERLTGYMTNGPFLALVLERENAIKGWRELIGPTQPDRARLQSPQTLRAHFGLTDTRNSFHGSDSDENFLKEYQLVFGKKHH